MKLSEAIERGALFLKTRGPDWDQDCWAAAAAGLAGQLVEDGGDRALYWDNPWGIVPGSDLEMWLRGTIRERYRWADVLKRLRRYNA